MVSLPVAAMDTTHADDVERGRRLLQHLAAGAAPVMDLGEVATPEALLEQQRLLCGPMASEENAGLVQRKWAELLDGMSAQLKAATEARATAEAASAAAVSARDDAVRGASAATERGDDLQRRAEAAEGIAEQLQRDLATARGDTSRAREETRAAEERCDELVAQGVQHHERVVKAQAQTQRLEAALSDACRNQDALDAACRRETDHSRALASRVAQLEAELGEARQQADGEARAIGVSLEHATSNLALLEDQHRLTAAELADLQRRHQDVAEERDALAEDVRELRRELDARPARSVPPPPPGPSAEPAVKALGVATEVFRLLEEQHALAAAALDARLAAQERLATTARVQRGDLFERPASSQAAVHDQLLRQSREAAGHIVGVPECAEGGHRAVVVLGEMVRAAYSQIAALRRVHREATAVPAGYSLDDVEVEGAGSAITAAAIAFAGDGSRAAQRDIWTHPAARPTPQQPERPVSAMGAVDVSPIPRAQHTPRMAPLPLPDHGFVTPYARMRQALDNTMARHAAELSVSSP